MDNLNKTYKDLVYRIPIEEYADVTEKAMLTNQFGIYISYGEGIHAYHGNQPLNYDLCEELGVRVVDLKYNGGTILGSEKDLSIIMVFPQDSEMNHELIINKIAEIIGNYIPNVTVDGNDILVNGDKISGSMVRIICGSFVWAAQISFEDYSDYIAKLCDKPQVKKPTFIDSSVLTRDQLEEEILQWLSTFTI